MAVNIQITAGTGTTLAADEVTIFSTTAKTQVVKMSIGTDGAHDGLVDDAFPMPVGGSHATALGKTRDAASTGSDVGAAMMAVRRDSETSLADTNGDWMPIGASQYGAAHVNLDVNFQASTARGILKAEDTAHVSGDAGVMVLGVRNDADAVLSGTDLDYTPFATNDKGHVKVIQGTGSDGIAKLEDTAAATGHMGAFVLGIRNDAVTTFAASDGDYSGIATDRYGRVRVVPEANVEIVGVAIRRDLDCDETAQVMTTSPGMLYGFDVINTSGAVAWLKFYDTVAAPVVGTDTPDLTIGIPAGESKHVWYGTGIPFSNRIYVACLTGVADSDTTGPALNEVVGNFYYRS